MHTFNIAFLGLSHPHCEGRLKAARSIDGIAISGVYDDNARLADAVASANDLRRYESEEDVYADSSLALIVIEGRNVDNARIASRCVVHGKNILLEKPGAESAESLRKLAQAVEQHRVFCQVGYHLRYSPSVARAKEILQDKSLGRITTGRFHAAVMAPWLTSEWFCDPKDRGGLIFNDFCHMLDLLRMLIGSPTAWSARIVKLDGLPQHPFEDSAAFILEFGDILIAGDCCGWEANDWISTWDIQLFGTEGTLEVGIHPPRNRLFRRLQNETVCDTWEDPDFDGELNYRFELQDVMQRITDGQPPGGCNVEDALAVVETIQAMYAGNGM